jgi:hypothetical protein
VLKSNVKRNIIALLAGLVIAPPLFYGLLYDKHGPA